MLGLILSGQQWCWCASGKHPVAKDFIRLGRMFPLAVGMAEWVDKGYSAANVTLKNDRQPRFWRFWARGAAGDELACGFLRDSSDSIGRPYPLLAMGAGPVPAWEEHWDLLTGACENTWNRLEYFCARNPADLAGMERELAAMRVPEPNWRDCRTTREAGMKATKQSAPDLAAEVRITRPRDGEELRMELHRNVPDHLVLASHLLSRLKAEGRAAPSTVFIGGAFDVTSLVMYWRPLSVGDFMVLWGES